MLEKHCQPFLENRGEESLTKTQDLISIFFASLEKCLPSLHVKTTAISLSGIFQEDDMCCGNARKPRSQRFAVALWANYLTTLWRFCPFLLALKTPLGFYLFVLV